ncbi:hypothetical protein LLR47_26595 [Bacillus cereus]|uniref:hypothetical protein n=1 Tax=Bacillus cereus TaxID=1396 RepID=UPI001D13CB9E|nr:hypothetical protein [Bacillus cereus]MCC3688753.1 hypothetical protein [Bacillus cereus]
MKIIRQLVGTKNTSSLDLKELDQRFKTTELFRKLANISNDFGKGAIRSYELCKINF